MIGRLPRSIVGLATLASLALAISTIVLGAVVNVVSHEALERQLDHRIIGETHHLRLTFDQHGVAALVGAIARREEGRLEGELGYMLVAPDGRQIAGRLDARMPPSGWHELLPFRHSASEPQSIAQTLVTPLAGGYTLAVAADRRPIDESDATIIRTFAIAFGSMLLIGLSCAWILGLVVRRRLGKISLTAKAIMDGDLSRRVPRDPSRNEFDRLAETLNLMLDRNEALLTNLQQVTSDIAHDLRGPLARQKRALDAALEAPPDIQRYHETIRIAADTGQEILDLFSALLRISEIESYRIREAFRPVILGEVVERVADAFRADAEAGGRTLAVRIDPVEPVLGDRPLLAQMLANLVENALLYTPVGSTVVIALAKFDGKTLLTVDDDGPGIPYEDRERVLQRFVRLEPSRTTSGHGLGLSLVAAIAKAHFADLFLSQNGLGLSVRLSFPGQTNV